MVERFIGSDEPLARGEDETASAERCYGPDGHPQVGDPRVPRMGEYEWMAPHSRSTQTSSADRSSQTGLSPSWIG